MPFKVQSRVQPQVLPAVRQQIPTGAADFGALEAGVIQQVGRDISRFGAGVAEVAEEERIKEEKIETQARKAREKFQEEKDKVWARDATIRGQNWFRDNKINYINQTGIDADGVGDKAKKESDKMIQTLVETAENDRRKELLRWKLLSEQDIFLNSIKNHEINEHFSAKEEGINALIENSIRNASDNYDNSLAIFGARMDLDTALIDKTEGMTAEAAKNMKSETVSLFHLGILNRKVAANAQDAQEYYDKNFKEILPENRDAVLNVIGNETILQDSAAAAKEIAIKESDRTKWEDMARNFNFTGTAEEKIKKQDETLRRVKIKKQELKQLDVEKNRESLDDLTDKIIDSETLEEALEWADQATGTERLQLRGVASAQFKLKTEKIETDPVEEEIVYDRIRRQLIKTKNQLIRETKGKFSNEDLSKAIDYFNQGGEVGNIKEDGMRSKFNEIMGIQPKEDPFLYKLARDFVVDQVIATGKPPTPTNIDEWMGNALLSGFETETVSNIFFDPTAITFVEAIERRIPFTADITDDEKRNIISDIEEHNKNLPIESRIIINDEVIERIFLRDEGLTEEQINTIMGI